MKKELKDRWVAALRSGEYRQGVNALKYSPENAQPKYCCLGVLAELAEPSSLVTVGGLSDFHGSVSFLRCSESDYLYLSKEIQHKLSVKNDRGLDFTKIADWIEKNVPEDNE
jgi:hypothetical protein